MKRDYFEGADVAVTICAKDGTILDMNGKSRRTFLKPCEEEIIGKNVLDCHPEPARSLLADMLKMERGQKKSETGLEHLDREEFILKKLKNEQKAVKEKTEALELEIKGLDFDEKELSVPEVETDWLVKKAKDDIQKELSTPVPVVGREKWREIEIGRASCRERV